jgi:hypothetical protein
MIQHLKSTTKVDHLIACEADHLPEQWCKIRNRSRKSEPRPIPLVLIRHCWESSTAQLCAEPIGLFQPCLVVSGLATSKPTLWENYLGCPD